MKTIKSFTDLKAWQKGHELVLLIYKMTRTMPESERFGIISQMQRAAVSVTSNIAEGFGRSTGKDKDHFYTMAYGSLLELQNQLLVAKDLGYMRPEEFKKAGDLSIECAKVLSGLRKANKERSDASI